MNGQLNYIIHASIILALAAGTVFFFQKIPLESNPVSEDNLVEFSGTQPTRVELTERGQLGKNLFTAKCASCHHLSKVMVGPALLGFEEKEPWTDSSKIYDWIRDPSAFMQKDSYTKQLKEKFGTMMQGFPGMSDEEIDAIREYIRVSQ